MSKFYHDHKKMEFITDGMRWLDDHYCNRRAMGLIKKYCSSASKQLSAQGLRNVRVSLLDTWSGRKIRITFYDFRNYANGQIGTRNDYETNSLWDRGEISEKEFAIMRIERPSLKFHRTKANKLIRHPSGVLQQAFDDISDYTGVDLIFKPPRVRAKRSRSL